MNLREYLNASRPLPFKARMWDCGKFATLWIAQVNPKAGRAAAKMLVEAGYNDVEEGDEEGLNRVYASFGCRTPNELVHHFNKRFPQFVDLPRFPQPGDIVVRKEHLSFGIVDEDHLATFLAKPHGFKKQPLRDVDAFLRIKA